MGLNIVVLYLRVQMGIDNFESTYNRKAWRNKNGSVVASFTGILEPGEYEINKKIDSDGTIILECELIEAKV